MDAERVPKIFRPFLIGRRTFREILQEALEWIKLLATPRGVLVALPVLVGVGVVCVAQLKGVETKYWKGPNEVAAIYIMSAATAVFLLRSILFRQRFDVLLLALAAAFLCREIHFAGTSKGVYVAVAIIGLWGWAWRDSIIDAMEGRRTMKTVLVGMVWSYFVSLVVQRRLGKHLPFGEDFHNFEHSVHVALEEVTENISHTIFLLAGLAGFLPPEKKDP